MLKTVGTILDEYSKQGLINKQAALAALYLDDMNEARQQIATTQTAWHIDAMCLLNSHISTVLRSGELGAETPLSLVEHAIRDADDTWLGSGRYIQHGYPEYGVAAPLFDYMYYDLVNIGRNRDTYHYVREALQQKYRCFLWCNLDVLLTPVDFAGLRLRIDHYLASTEKAQPYTVQQRVEKHGSLVLQTFAARTIARYTLVDSLPDEWEVTAEFSNQNGRFIVARDVRPFYKNFMFGLAVLQQFGEWTELPLAYPSNDSFGTAAAVNKYTGEHYMLYNKEGGFHGE